MCRAYHAGRSDDWESYLEEFRNDNRLSIRASMKVTESYNEVEAEHGGCLSIAQDILRKSTDLLRRIIAPSDGVKGVTLSCVCPHCRCFPIEDYIWYGKKQC